MEEAAIDQVGDLSELFVFEVLPSERFDHSNAVQILLNRGVQFVIILEHANERGVNGLGNRQQNSAQERHESKENQAEAPFFDHGHRKGKDEHHWGANDSS